VSESVAAAETAYRRCLEETDQDLKRRLQDIHTASGEREGKVRQDHQDTVARAEQELKRVAAGAGLWAAPWDDPRWAEYRPTAEPPPVARFGSLTVTGSATSTSFETPALIPFTSGQSMVFRTSRDGKVQAVAAVQALTLRLLALVPPGKLRLLLIDPMGLGENLAMFMNLAQKPIEMPELVGDKVWTEQHDIEKRLADLSGHMEMVFQTYLRGHYESMEQYNREAGEVAEPYRLVVVMDFPVNFSEDAAKRLVSIASKGPRCGVYAVVLVDTDQPPPHGFNLADLEVSAHVVMRGPTRFVWQDPGFATMVLELDAPPSRETFERLIHTIGAAAKEASKVEVPFDKIMPPAAAWWRSDSASGLEVPIGRAGARELQHFEVGQGTAQHALVAGRTGSGKSTLMHTLITGLAMAYPPEELELYLVDFKKGVEFKDYATHLLPHARVVAVESEREFGLSVLQGLDAELERRGEAFRSAGCNALADYRRSTSARLPRVLLLVDEFQEFFTEDDGIARQAAVLLDRLARQGRAFGMHVLLGSQTLAGAYSLARSTIDQMAIRIAMQCSEADSRLILSEDNPAARLLSRPGDAFYNAMSGEKEGNRRFQVAWLHDDQRKAYLKQIHDFAQAQGAALRKPIVFEGNAPARLEEKDDHPLKALLALGEWPVPPPAVPAWLGEPIAIKEPTAALFSRHAGRNLIIVGRDEASARGMLTSALLSLAAQHHPEDVRFYLSDMAGMSGDDVTLPTLKEALPHEVRLVPRRRLEETLQEIHAIVAERAKEDRPGGPAIYFVLVGIQRARDLRRDDDFSSYHKEEGVPPSPPELFRGILRDGAEVGVHVLAWADSGAALGQVVDRKGMNEFGLRVALAMPDRDSSDLLDSSAAAKLGPYRALLMDEERPGVLEKFRPYEKPSVAWLADMGRRLRDRSRNRVG